MTLNEDPIIRELDLSEGEKALLAGAETGTTSQINKTRVYADIYVTKGMRRAVKDLIDSNLVLSQSNERHARALNWLTAGLLFLGIVQVVLQALR